MIPGIFGGRASAAPDSALELAADVGAALPEPYGSTLVAEALARVSDLGPVGVARLCQAARAVAEHGAQREALLAVGDPPLDHTSFAEAIAAAAAAIARSARPRS